MFNDNHHISTGNSPRIWFVNEHCAHGNTKVIWGSTDNCYLFAHSFIIRSAVFSPVLTKRHLQSAAHDTPRAFTFT